MELLMILFFLGIHLSFLAGMPKNNSLSQSRAARFLNFFQIVTLKNQPYDTFGTEESGGVCYSPWECSERGGEESGNCASGFGRCCVIKTLDDR